MGTVIKPSDFLRGKKRLVEELTRDLDPGNRETVRKILESWKEGESQEELRKLVGRRLSKRMLRGLNQSEQ